MMDFTQKLKQFLHDPIDKPFDIKTHEQRAKEYAEILGVKGLKEAKYSDRIASTMERSLLPKNVIQEFNEIKHPFSEEKKEIEINGIDRSEVFNSVKNALEEVANELKYWDDEKKFLYLWRNLLTVIEEKSEGKPFRKYWSVVPADTRIPDHSIWEHLKITSSINAFENLQNNSILLFTIGPVQSFISQARKAQDLFMGSFLLSYLTFTAISKIVKVYGPTAVIYPDLYSQPLMDWYLEHIEKINVKRKNNDFFSYSTIPNRFVTIIPETNQNKIKEFANELEKATRTEWEHIVNKVLEVFKINIGKDLVCQQLTNFPQIYWVLVPWKKEAEDIRIDNLVDFIETGEIERWRKFWQFAEKNGEYSPNIGFLYQLIYTSLEKSMGARKNLRDFVQSEEQKKKCSICGEKEAIIQSEIGNLKIGRFISEGEKLCVTCFTKRGAEKYFYEKFGEPFKDFSFPSTAEVALSYFKEKAIREAKEEFKNYIEKFKHLMQDKFPEVQPLPRLKESFKDIENLEGEWFFKENLTQKQFEKQLGLKNVKQEEIDELKDKLKKLTEKIGPPNPYYAIIMLDADNMGKWLSGELLPEIEHSYNSNSWQKISEDFKKELENLQSKKILTPAIHASISTALRNYSIEFVQKIVEEEHYGKLIYAGGDDMLAFVNLKDLFELMRKLRAAFSGNIKFENGKIKVDWENNTGFVEKDDRLILTMGENASASCGVVITHYKMPLKLVLDKVREMEQKAKKVPYKDSFAIALIKHSGQIREFTCKWRFDSDNEKTDTKDTEKIDTIEKMKEIGEFFVGKDGITLSKTFIQKIYNEFVRLKDKEERFIATEAIFDTELKRLLKRSLEGGKDEERKEKAETLAKTLLSLFWHSGIGGNLSKFANLLETISFVSKVEE